MPSARPLMPGSFGPEDYLDSHQDYFDDRVDLQEKPEDRHFTIWAVDNLPEFDVGDVIWHQYDPPKALGKLPHVSSQALLDLAAASVDNVRTRALEEAQEMTDEEARRLADARAEREARRAKDLYLPIIIVDTEAPEIITPSDAPTQNSPSTHPEASVDNSVVVEPPEIPIPSPPISVKGRLSALRRLLQRGGSRNVDQGESSAMGSAREVLHKLERKLDAGRRGYKIPSGEGSSQQALSDLIVECVSCLDDVPVKDTVRVPCHHYCHECFAGLINTAMNNEQQWPPKCCLNPIPFRDVLKALPDDMKAPFQQKVAESEVPASERVYCHAADCNVWVRPDQIDISSSQGRCSAGHSTCTICRGAAHDTADCPNDWNLRLTNILAEDEGWKRCFNCSALVEHGEACQHMTCLCGTQFCYVCGLRWRTCACTMQQLYDLKEAADVRREQRAEQEQEEADELRLILAQIEELEREQEAQAERLRLEQVRVEEERRQREMEERVRVESLRRREVELKYEELRGRLDELHEVQSALLDADQGQQVDDLARDLSTRKTSLMEAQAADRTHAKVRIDGQVATKEEMYTMDYSLREAQERKVESDYHLQLRLFFAGKPDEDEEIKRLMLPLQDRMEKNRRTWQTWKDEEVAAYRAQLEDNRTMQEEIMYSTVQRLIDTCDEKVLDLRRRKVAEKKWFELVMLERERLFAKWEEEEMEGNADRLLAGEDGTQGVRIGEAI